MYKTCIIITTINSPTTAIIEYSKITNITLIIVCDIKTPIKEYTNINCILLTLEQQQKLYPTLYNILPFNHYCRKNIGYIYAIKNNYDIIIDTDDDNIPNDIFFENINTNFNNYTKKIITNTKYINIYKLFSSQHIWPRGYPLKEINNNNVFDLKDYDESNIGIIQGLVNGDPDVDSIYRLTSNNDKENFKFNNSKDMFVLNYDTYCPANTQNTYWLNKNIFYLLYIPSYISFRFCDILKMYIAQRYIKKNNLRLSFIEPTVFQIRNQHNLIKDFNDEIDMFMNTDKLIELLDNLDINNEEIDLIHIYKLLIDNNIIKNNNELDILYEWNNLIKDI
jgi:hypothetical protein